MKNFLDIPDLPHDAFQPTKIGLRSKMSLHKGGGSQTSYTSAYPEWAEPQVEDLFERGNLASLQPYQPYELGGSYQTEYGIPGSGPSGYSTDATEYEKQQNLGVDSDAYKALQASGQLIQQKSGYTGPDEALRARLATPEGLEAYVNEQTIGRGIKADLTPLEKASYAQAEGLSIPGMFQNTYSGYTPSSSMYEAEKQRYEDQQAFLGGLTDAKAQDIAFGAATPTATDLEGNIYAKGQEGYGAVDENLQGYKTDVGEAPGSMGWRNEAGEQFFGDAPAYDEPLAMAHDIVLGDADAKRAAAGYTQFGSGVLDAEGNRIYEGSDAYNELAVVPEVSLTAANFDPDAYLTANPDVAKSGKYKNNPWGHYLKYGIKEGRNAPMKSDATATGLEGLETFSDDMGQAYGGVNPWEEGWASQRDYYDTARGELARVGAADYDAGFTQQDLLNDIEILKFDEKMLNPGQTGYEGAKALHERAVKAGELEDIRERYKREGTNYIESYLPGMATQGEGPLGEAMNRLRSDVSGREFGSYADPTTGKVVTDKGNKYDFGYQAPGAITQADIDEIDAMPGLSDEQRAARKAQLGSAVNYYKARDLTSTYSAGELESAYTAPGAVNQADVDAINALNITQEQKEARIAQLGGAANYYAAGELGDTAKYSATDNTTAIGDFTPEQIKALEDAGYDPTDIALQDADAGYTARQMVGEEFDADMAKKYMDPYKQGITDIALASAEAEDLKYQNVLAAQAVQAGAFGGDREAILDSERERNYQKLISDIQTQGSQKAYESAQAQFEADRAARMQAQQLTEGFRQKAAELDKSAIEFDETSDQTAARIGLEGYAKEQQAKQTEQQLLSDAWKANQAAAQVAGAQGIDAYAKEQQAKQTQQQLISDAYAKQEAAKQTQQQLTTDSWKANQAAAQAAAKGQLDADKLSESSGQFAATNALNRAKTENELFVSQAQLEMASSKLSMEQIQLANKLGGQQRGFTQQQLDLLQNENFAAQGWDQQQAAWLGALFSGSLLPNTAQKADSGESGINTLLGALGTAGSLVT